MATIAKLKHVIVVTLARGFIATPNISLQYFLRSRSQMKNVKNQKVRIEARTNINITNVNDVKESDIIKIHENYCQVSVKNFVKDIAYKAKQLAFENYAVFQFNKKESLLSAFVDKDVNRLLDSFIENYVSELAFEYASDWDFESEHDKVQPFYEMVEVVSCVYHQINDLVMDVLNDEFESEDVSYNQTDHNAQSDLNDIIRTKIYPQYFNTGHFRLRHYANCIAVKCMHIAKEKEIRYVYQFKL